MQDTPPELETYPFVVDHQKMLDGMGAFGWRVATSDEHEPMMALAEKLLGSQLTKAKEIERINSITQMTSWVFGEEEIEGIFIVVPLSPEGLEALKTADFDPSGPDAAHLAALGTPCAGVYTGAYAGTTYDSRKAVMTATAIVRVQVFGQVPAFARAATEDGARTMVSLGFAPAGFGADKLWMQPVINRPEREVA
ncbi:MAG: hypothetical protein AAGL11_07445 [Pseudomonadota bacterium]